MQRKPPFCTQSVFCLGILIVCVVITMFAAGCGDNNAHDKSRNRLKIGLMITPHGLNDKGFNDYAYDGLKEAEKKYNIEGTIIEPSTMKDLEASLRFFAGQKFDAIIAVGAGFTDAIRIIASENPDLNFYVIDSDINEGRIRGISFREDEGSYLCGYLAAKMSKTKKLGFIGGLKIPVIERFAVGYRNGVLAAASSAEVIERYVATDFSGFNNAKEASRIAQEMYQSGCDVIFPAAGASGLGVIAAAVKTRNFVLGVDMNQDSLAPGLVLTSMLKRVDLVVEDIIRSLCENGNPELVKRSYGLSDGAIGLTDFQLSFKVVGEDLINELGRIRKLIIDKKIITNKVEGLN
ncbi:MAG: BMP family ABC transporter substrate-binding protein [Candidatus Rifleibacteriota bacterium]